MATKRKAAAQPEDGKHLVGKTIWWRMKAPMAVAWQTGTVTNSPCEGLITVNVRDNNIHNYNLAVVQVGGLRGYTENTYSLTDVEIKLPR